MLNNYAWILCLKTILMHGFVIVGMRGRLHEFIVKRVTLYALKINRTSAKRWKKEARKKEKG